MIILQRHDLSIYSRDRDTSNGQILCVFPESSQGDSGKLDSNAELRVLVVSVSAAPCEIDRKRAHTGVGFGL